MRSTAPSTDRRARRQGGQAIVLIALMMLVMFGMLGLAVDAGRAYVDRRQMQDAVDAATLAAGDSYENYGDETKAYNNAYAVFQRVLTLSGGTSSINLGTHTMTASWSGTTYQYSIGMSNNAFNGTIFTATSQHIFPLTFFQVLGSSPTIPIAAQASAIVGNQTSQPALLTLGSGCSLTMSGSTAITVRGDVYSDGCISNSGSSSLGVGGSVYAHTNPFPSNISYLCYNPDPNVPPHGAPCAANETQGQAYPTAPVINDPKYPGPTQSQINALPVEPANTTHPGGWVETHPGYYTSDFVLTGGKGCYFFDPGIYDWTAGYTSHGQFASNELKPPDEPSWNYTTNVMDYTSRASPQFWYQYGSPPNDCSASFAVSATATSPSVQPASSQWSIEVTSTRTDNGYVRESAPSMCRGIAPPSNDGIVVDLTNGGKQVPGATGYNIYVAFGNCGGGSSPAQSAFGYVASVTENTPTITLDGNALPNPYSVLNGRPAAQCSNPGSLTKGCAPPDGEGPSVCFIGCTAGTSNNLAQGNAKSAIVPSGDLANENFCKPNSTNAAVPCEGATTTPGAIQFYFPSNACINENGNGATWVFSGYQYDWIIIYEPGNYSTPGPANTCSANDMNGGSNTQYIGTAYTPAAGWTINGGNKAPLAGQVITNNATMNGNSTIGIDFNPNYAPAPPAARLTQ